MTHNAKSGITRRNLLKSTAKGVVGLGAIASLGLKASATTMEAQTYWTKERTERYLCKQIHFSKSTELTRMLHSPYLDKQEKNLAIKTAHCPKCNVRIHPAQVVDPYVVAA